MTNWELTQTFLKEGVILHTFVIMDNHFLFDKEGVKHMYGSYSVWDKKSFDSFIEDLKKYNGICFILNSGLNEFTKHGGYLRMYKDTRPFALRSIKLAKIRSMVFKHQMENNGI